MPIHSPLILMNSIDSWSPGTRTRNWLTHVLRFWSSPILRKAICWLVLRPILGNRRSVWLASFRINYILLQILFIYTLFMILCSFTYLCRISPVLPGILWAWCNGTHSLPWILLWLWPKGQTFLLRSQRKGALREILCFIICQHCL